MSEGPGRGSPSRRSRRPNDDESDVNQGRAKINPIFLWASQNDQQKIIEVRCEDYDKRNRIKLTKTAYGWRSIPRTAYSVVLGNSASTKSMENQTPPRGPPTVPPSRPPPTIDLEDIQKSKHYQPRVVLEQLRVSRIHAPLQEKNEKCPVSCCLSAVSNAAGNNNNNNNSNNNNNNYTSSRKILEALRKTPGLSVSLTTIEEISKPDSQSEQKRRRLESPESTTAEDRPEGIVRDCKGSEALPKASTQKRSAFLERLLPSPPCSVSCSEDARNDITLKSILSTPNLACYIRQRMNADNAAELPLDPATQLKELIENTEYLIPDPLLVPRHCLPGLAAAPAIEIPKLLMSRPELRLPEALSKPELLRDPDLLVISLAHLQEVLNEAEGTQARKPKLTCKPIDTLMPSPIDLSYHKDRVGNHSAHRGVHPPPLLRVRSTGLFKQESEVSSTGGSIDETHLWHPLFGCQKRPHHQEQHDQQAARYHPSWHRTTLAS